MVENVPLSPPPGATPDTAQGGRRGPTPGTQGDCGAAAGPRDAGHGGAGPGGRSQVER